MSKLADSIKLNTPVTTDGITQTVSRMRGTGHFSIFLQGATVSEGREIADNFFEVLGLERGEMLAHSGGLVFGQAR